MVVRGRAAAEAKHRVSGAMERRNGEKNIENGHRRQAKSVNQRSENQETKASARKAWQAAKRRRHGIVARQHQLARRGIVEIVNGALAGVGDRERQRINGTREVNGSKIIAKSRRASWLRIAAA